MMIGVEKGRFRFARSLVAQMVKCLPTMRETGVQSLGQEDLLENQSWSKFNSSNFRKYDGPIW